MKRLICAALAATPPSNGAPQSNGSRGLWAG